MSDDDGTGIPDSDSQHIPSDCDAIGDQTLDMEEKQDVKTVAPREPTT